MAALTTTPFTQPNSIAVVVNSQFGVPSRRSGVVDRRSDVAVIIGGITSIGRVAEKIAPLKVGLYVVGGLSSSSTSPDSLPSVLVAGRPRSARRGGRRSGFGVMIAMRYGVARGVYANEAGYGTAAVAYGTAKSDEPVAAGPATR